jgi:hypothetical protein
MVDAFATGLQLAQILLYELDGMHRRDSNTLWMRTTTLTTLSPHRTFGPRLPLRTRLADPQLLEMKDGVWRTAEIRTEFAGVAFTCGVTHALPHGS